MLRYRCPAFMADFQNAVACLNEIFLNNCQIEFVQNITIKMVNVSLLSLIISDFIWPLSYIGSCHGSGKPGAIKHIV